MKKRGLSLIELLIAMSFIGVLSAVVATVYVTGFNTYRQELASSTVQSNAQTILDALITDARNGVLIEPTYDSFTTGADTIIIRIPAIDASQNILYSGSDMIFDRIIYYYSGNEIHKVTFADPLSSRFPKNGIDSVLDKNILVLNFTYEPDPTAPTLVTATISSEVQAGNRTRSITLTGQARLRNHI